MRNTVSHYNFSELKTIIFITKLPYKAPTNQALFNTRYMYLCTDTTTESQ